MNTAFKEHAIKMTSNNSPAPYKVQVSSAYDSTYAGWKAFNDSNKSDSDCWSANSNKGYITFDFGVETNVAAVNITSRFLALTGAPKDFTIEGSNDNSNWVVLKTVINEIDWKSNETRSFELGGNRKFRYFKLNITSNNGRVRLDIGLIKFFEISTNKISFIYHDNKYKKYNDFKPYDLLPTMNSNVAPSGIVSASSTRSTDHPYYAFDKKGSTLWVANSTSNQWIQYEFPNAVILRRYSLFSNSPTNQSPKSIAIQGSNNNIDFFNLDVRDNLVYPDSRELTFDIENTTPYKYIRLYIFSNGGNSVLSIGELKLYGFSDNTELKKGIEVFSSTLPTSEQFLEEGMHSLSPLFDRTLKELESSTMTDKSEILPAGEEGKVFSEKLNLKTLPDIRIIKIEVK